MIHSSTLGFSPRPPVSVCGTGTHTLSARSFSWKPLGSLSDCPRTLGTITFGWSDAFNYQTNTYWLQRGIPSPRGPFITPSLLHLYEQYGNINPLSIDYPSRVRLRPRLTLIRLTLIRKPGSYGGRVSRPPYRYLCLHLLFQTLQHPLQDTFAALGMLPYHSYCYESFASVLDLMPDYYRRPVARPVSCYALFKGIAASKLTSWLSLQLDHLCST